jgi:hypothetical protein
MNLAELAFACYVYGRINDFDGSYLRFLRNTSPQLDLSQEQHRKALLKWLNDWGCRQFAKNDHDLASEEIRVWFRDIGSQVLPLNKDLLDFSEGDYASVKAAYVNLVKRTASKRALPRGHANVTFGPTGTAKILFALRPSALVPWDEAIRSEFNFGGSGSDYVNYLRFVRKNLEELNDACERSGHELSNLPKMLGRPESSLAKLIDEYFWLAVRKCRAPTSQILMQWAQWC